MRALQFGELVAQYGQSAARGRPIGTCKSRIPFKFWARATEFYPMVRCMQPASQMLDLARHLKRRPRTFSTEPLGLATGPAGARVLFHLSAETPIAERLGGCG
jgi:hypothetical protein